MAAPSTLLRFRIQLSNIDAGIYGDLDFRISKHPSETDDYLITRVIAYALNYKEGVDLEITPGLCVDDLPALFRKDPSGAYELWIEIGNPSAKRLHKASKATRELKVYTYKDPENLKREAAGEKIHNRDAIKIFSIDPKFLKKMAAHLDRDNTWGIIFNDGELTFSIGNEALTGTLQAHHLDSA